MPFRPDGGKAAVQGPEEETKKGPTIFIVKPFYRKICENYGNLMGWLTGLEPATTGTTIQGSNQLNYSHHDFDSSD